MQQTIAQSQERERQQLEAGDEERRTVRSGQATADDQTGEDISTYERLANTVVNAGNMGSEFFNLQPDFQAVSVQEDASMVRWKRGSIRI